MQKVIRILQLRIFGDEGDGSTSSQEVFHASPFPLPAGSREWHGACEARGNGCPPHPFAGRQRKRAGMENLL